MIDTSGSLQLYSDQRAVVVFNFAGAQETDKFCRCKKSRSVLSKRGDRSVAKPCLSAVNVTKAAIQSIFKAKCLADPSFRVKDILSPELILETLS